MKTAAQRRAAQQRQGAYNRLDEIEEEGSPSSEDAVIGGNGRSLNNGPDSMGDLEAGTALPPMSLPSLMGAPAGNAQVEDAVWVRSARTSLAFMGVYLCLFVTAACWFGWSCSPSPSSQRASSLQAVGCRGEE